MSVTLEEVIEAAGYDLSTRDDATWLLSKRQEFDDLCEEAEATIEKLDEEAAQHDNDTADLDD